jgi:hypothetical protein
MSRNQINQISFRQNILREHGAHALERSTASSLYKAWSLRARIVDGVADQSQAQQELPLPWL